MTSERIELAGGWYFRKQLVAGSWALNTPDMEISGWGFSEKEARAFAAAIEQPQAPAAREWQPIETAPKDGSQFLVWTNRIGFSVVTHDVENPMPVHIVPSGHHLLINEGKHGPYPLRGDYPTHWMPLPAAPTPDQGSEER